jgi:transposase
MKEIIKMLNKKLKYENHKIIGDEIYIRVKSKTKVQECPECGRKTKKVHSKYIRTVQDLPIGDKKVYIEIISRNMICVNGNCSRKRFAESYEFVGTNGVKTKRLEAEIVSVGMNMGSVAAADVLNRNTVKLCGRTVRNLIKKTEQEKSTKRV